MKQNRKALKAQIINEIAPKIKASYEQKLEIYEKTIARLSNDNKRLRNENFNLRNKVEPLEEKVQIYEDWINRLQDFVNLPEDERKEAVNQYIEEKKLKRSQNQLLDILMPYFSLFS